MPHPTHIGHFGGGADLAMQDLASGHVTVMSQHNDLQICRGISVKPSGLFPSVQNNPVGLLVMGGRPG